MATGYKGSNGAKTTDSRGFVFDKTLRFNRVLSDDIYGNYCNALGGWYQHAGSWSDSPKYATSGDYYSHGAINASGGISDYGSVIGTISEYTYWTVTTQNPARGGTVSGGGNYDDGSTCTITAKPYTGYVVTSIDGDSSYGDSPSTGNKTKKFTVRSDRADVTAAFEAYYTIAFQKNVPSGSGSAPVDPSSWPDDISPCLVNRSYQIPNTVPIRNGYKFLGWSTTAARADAGEIDYNPGDTFVRTASINPGQSVELYASWTRFTLSYDANGGSPTPASQSGYGNITLAAAPTKGGLIFDGWLIDGTKYIAGNSYNLGADTTAVAQWRGFVLTVTRSAIAGTLSLYDKTAGATVATESNGTLAYTGEVGHEYQIRCHVGTDNYRMPAGIAGLEDDSFTPESGETYSFSYSCPFYHVSLPAADEHGNVLAVTTPSARDAEVAVGGVTYPAYAAGRKLVITATTDPEFSLVRARILDANGYERAVYSVDSGNIVADAFEVELSALAVSFSVVPTYGEKHYAVSIAADAPSAAAFATLTATKSGGASAQSETAGTEVVFAATMNEGYSFEGFYIGGEPVLGVSESGGVYSFTHTVAADVAVVAKAKVSARLSLSDPASSTLAIAYGGESKTAGTAFDVTLGESLSYEVRVTAQGKYFNGWYLADGETPFPGYGISGEMAPTAALDIVAEIGNEDPGAPVYATFAYANGCDATMGAFSVDGVEGPQTKELAYDQTTQAPPTVALAAQPTNGHLFIGWFKDPSAQGTPVATGEGGILTVRTSGSYYAKFDKNPHAICEWEGSGTPKPMTWRSKTYEASKPFNPSACRVDALGYPPGNVPETDVPKVLELTVDMFSAPDKGARPTGSATLANIANQNARRLPVRRMERYMQIEVKSNSEIDAVLVGTSMGGLAQ